MNPPRTLIIAEAGVNHNGDIAMARRLIEVAAEAKVDMVKFQTFSADRLVTAHASKAEYQVQSTGKSESQRDMLSQLELSSEMHKALIKHCRLHGICFFSTAFDVESLDFLFGLRLDRIKIPSGEITNLPYLRSVATYGKPVILSTGMATLGEIESALAELETGGISRERITVLHCNTEYPTPMADVNLRAMCNIGKVFDVAVGYSDHTAGIEVAIAAVALGATIIEKHFTLDRNLPGPDHKASLEPRELKAMVDAIRNIEVALGDGIKRPSQSELKNKPIARKSIVAIRPIHKGDQFTQENIGIKRPGTGISPMLWNEVIGRIASRDFPVDELIEL
jgi:N,N'-diacetyllegionaminate synthase